MFGGPSIVFTKKAVVDETFFRDSTNWLKAIVGIDACQLYPFLCVKQCQLVCMQHGNLIRKLTNSNRIITRRGVLKTCSCHTFSESDLTVVTVYTMGTQRKNWCIQCWWLLWTLQHRLKLWDVIRLIAYVKKLVLFSLRKKYREAIKWES